MRNFSISYNYLITHRQYLCITFLEIEDKFTTAEIGLVTRMTRKVWVRGSYESPDYQEINNFVLTPVINLIIAIENRNLKWHFEKPINNR